MDDGGPAFPRPRSEGNLEVYDAQQGLSLRDWFAGQALSAVLANSGMTAAFNEQAKEEKISPALVAAQFVYGIADGMLEARKGEKP